MGSNNFRGGFRFDQHEPKDWFVVFYDRSEARFVNWLAMGRFKHVAVFGKVERSGAWVFYDFWLNRARIFVVGDWEADEAIANFIAGATVVRFPRLLADVTDVNLRPGLWCVPAVAHILGIHSSALRPDALFRQCLAKGGEIVSTARHDHENSEDSGRP